MDFIDELRKTKSRSLPSLEDLEQPTQMEDLVEPHPQPPPAEQIEDRLEAFQEIMNSFKEGGTISSDDLDNKIKSLFEKFSNEETRIPQKSSHMPVKLSHDAPPPESWFKPLSPYDDPNLDRKLTRRSKITQLFGQIPTFANDGNVTARDFLLSLNYVMSEWKGAIFKEEFLSIAISKLSAKIRNNLISQNKISDLDSIYGCLLALYDGSENKRQAFFLLTNQNRRFENVSQFLNEVLRLLGLSDIPEQNQSDVVIQSIQSSFPPTACEKKNHRIC